MKREFTTEWEENCYNDAKAAMETLLNLANAMGSNKAIVAGMLDGFLLEHRTLQQASIRNFVGMLQEWAKFEEASASDPRNKDAWDFAQDIVKLDLMFGNI